MLNPQTVGPKRSSPLGKMIFGLVILAICIAIPCGLKTGSDKIRSGLDVPFFVAIDTFSRIVVVVEYTCIEGFISILVALEMRLKKLRRGITQNEQENTETSFIAINKAKKNVRSFTLLVGVHIALIFLLTNYVLAHLSLAAVGFTAFLCKILVATPNKFSDMVAILKNDTAMGFRNLCTIKRGEGVSGAEQPLPRIHHYLGVVELVKPPAANEKSWQDTERSDGWLIPILDTEDRVAKYCLSLHAGTRIKWRFSVKCRTKPEAEHRARTLLEHLRLSHPGLDGKVMVEPVSVAEYNAKAIVYTIPLPGCPIIEQVPLMKRLLHVVENARGKVDLHVLFKRVDGRFLKRIHEAIDGKSRWSSAQKKALKEKWINPPFLVKVFAKVPDEGTGAANRSLLDVLNSGMLAKKIKRCGAGAWRNILDFNMATRGLDGVVTSNFLDCTIPDDAFIEPEKDIDDTILLGLQTRDGVATAHEIRLPINQLASGLGIFGKPGSGKSMVGGSVTFQAKHMKRGRGCLTINVGKSDQEALYDFDIALSPRDPGFVIPYIMLPRDERQAAKCLEETAKNIVAGLGMTDPIDQIVVSLILELWEKGEFPARFTDLLSRLLQVLEEQGYSKDVRDNINYATKNRVEPLLKKGIKDLIDTNTRLVDVVPWAEAVKQGKFVYLDLHDLPQTAQVFYVFFIMQVLRVIMPEQNDDVLRLLVLLDEAHKILAASRRHDDYSSEKNRTERIGTIFGEIIKEFRSRGVGIVILDQDVGALSEYVLVVGNQIVFRQPGRDAAAFTTDRDLQEKILNLQDRHAILLSGANRSHVEFRSVDYKKPGRLMQSSELNEGGDGRDDDPDGVKDESVDEGSQEGKRLDPGLIQAESDQLRASFERASRPGENPTLPPVPEYMDNVILWYNEACSIIEARVRYLRARVLPGESPREDNPISIPREIPARTAKEIVASIQEDPDQVAPDIFHKNREQLKKVAFDAIKKEEYGLAYKIAHCLYLNKITSLARDYIPPSFWNLLPNKVNLYTLVRAIHGYLGNDDKAMLSKLAEDSRIHEKIKSGLDIDKPTLSRLKDAIIQYNETTCTTLIRRDERSKRGFTALEAGTTTGGGGG